MNNPFLISIVIPAYNAGNFIEETLRAATSQTYARIEIVVVDDGSYDDTAAIVKRIARKDTRVRYLYEENQGQSAARRNGLLHSKGEWVTFLDADNIFLPYACEAVAEKLVSGCDVYYGDIRYFDTQNPGRVFAFGLHYTPEVTLESLIEHNFINFLGTFIKREKVSGCFDAAFRRADDHIIWLKLILQGAKFCYVDKVLGRLRFHHSNLSFQPSYLVETAETNLRIFDWLEEEVKKKYPPTRQEGIVRRITHQRGVWLLKGYGGALIMKQKKNAMIWLQQWQSFTHRTATYYLCYLITLAMPLVLLSPLLQYVRRILLMRKYTLVRDSDH